MIADCSNDSVLHPYPDPWWSFAMKQFNVFFPVHRVTCIVSGFGAYLGGLPKLRE